MQPAENEWTKIPNALLENMADLGNAELRVLLALIRKTAGYQKESDRVSVSQLVTMTGLTSRNAQNALTSLLASGHIGREQAGKQTFTYHVKPYPVGTRIDEEENHVPSDTRSLGDMVPYPLGTRIEEKPCPLGTTQKKDLKERKKESAPVASDDAPTPPVSDPPIRKPRKGKNAPPAEPPTPIAIRLVIADACAIDLEGGMATRGQVTSLNSEAKRIWTNAQRQGKTEAECVEAIKYVAGWIKRTVYPYSNGQPLKPSALLERWKGAMEARPKTNGSYANGHHVAPADPGILDAAEMRRQMAELRGGGGR